MNLQGFEVTDTAITSPSVMGCGCQRMSSVVSSVETMVNTLTQPVTDIMSGSASESVERLQTTANNLIGSDVKSGIKNVLNSLFSTDAFCSSECQNAVYNFGKIAETAAFSSSYSSLGKDLLNMSTSLSDLVPGEAKAVITTSYTDVLPCMCSSPTIKLDAAVDSIWTPVVDVLGGDIEGVMNGTTPNGQQVSAMLVAVVSTPANMGMCASSNCKNFLSNLNAAVTAVYKATASESGSGASSDSGSIWASSSAQCSASFVAGCMTKKSIITASKAEDLVTAGFASTGCSTSAHHDLEFDLSPIIWMSCGLASTCDDALSVTESYVQTAELIVAGALSDYDTDAKKTPIIAKFAKAVGAAIEDVTATFTAGSVKVTFEVKTKSAVSKAAFENTVSEWTASPSLASSALGVEVETVALQETTTRLAPSPPPPPTPPSPSSPPPGSPGSSGVNVALIGGVVGGVVALVCIVAIVVVVMMKQKHKKKEVTPQSC